MKKWTAMILALVMCFSLCACGNSGEAKPSDEALETESAAEPSLAVSGEESEVASLLTDDAVRALAEQHFDLSSYEITVTSLWKKEAKVDRTVDTADVDGVTLTIGMSYQEVLELGFTPTDETFPDTETEGLAYMCDFTTRDNHVVSLGFIGEKGQTVAKGELYKICSVTKGDACATVTVEQVKIGSSIDHVVNVLGEPQRISQNGNQECTLRLEYYVADRSLYLILLFDPASELVTYVSLEGYEE